MLVFGHIYNNLSYNLNWEREIKFMPILFCHFLSSTDWSTAHVLDIAIVMFIQLYYTITLQALHTEVDPMELSDHSRLEDESFDALPPPLSPGHDHGDPFGDGENREPPWGRFLNGSQWRAAKYFLIHFLFVIGCLLNLNITFTTKKIIVFVSTAVAQCRGGWHFFGNHWKQNHY